MRQQNAVTECDNRMRQLLSAATPRDSLQHNTLQHNAGPDRSDNSSRLHQRPALHPATHRGPRLPQQLSCGVSMSHISHTEHSTATTRACSCSFNSYHTDASHKYLHDTYVSQDISISYGAFSRTRYCTCEQSASPQHPTPLRHALHHNAGPDHCNDTRVLFCFK